MIRQTARHLFSLLDHGRRSTAVLVAASVVAGLTEGAALVVVVRVAVDLASDTVSSDFVPFVFAPTSAVAALAIAAAFALTTLAAHLFIARESAALSGQVLYNARARALRAFTRAGWATQSTQRTGALQESVSTLSLVTSTVTQVFATGVTNLVMLTMFLMVAALVNPLGTLVVVGAGAGVFAIIRPLGNRTRESGAAFARADSSLAEDTAAFASSAMELRAFGVGDVAERQLESVLDDVADKQRSVRFTSALGTSLYRDVAVMLLVISVGVLTVLDRDAVGSVSAVVVLVIRALASAHAVNAMVHAMNERGPTVELLMERIGELERAAAPTGSVELSAVTSIDLHDVSYRYPDGVAALDSVTFSLRKGDSLGIVGPSGGGKTTLIQLLLGLRRPTGGEILVNGCDSSDFEAESWARRVAYVPQEPSLFEGTIAANIAFFRDVDTSSIEAAAAQANVADEIARLPLGFETVLGPGGAGLSGGQKQRVAIARALVGEPELLILDEPSSALDPRSEMLLRRTLESLAGNTTVVLVAHRDTTVQACERLIRLEHGVLVDDHVVADPGDVDLVAPPPRVHTPGDPLAATRPAGGS